MIKKIALLSSQGTACSETVLLEREDTPEMRASIESQYCDSSSPDAPIPGSWTDVTDNEACGPEQDIHYTNHGSIITMQPLTPAAHDWIAENLPDDALSFGGSIAIEPRYFGDIAYGAQEDGLTSNVRVEPR